MGPIQLLFILGCLQTPALAAWVCAQDSDCADLEGSVCHSSGACGCPAGQQVALAGSACVDLAPYHTSRCVEDHQCSRLFTMFECRRENATQPGSCRCQAGFHYFLGRCWPTAGFGAACARDEECLGVPRDPYSMRCDGTCACARGYYQRQRGECRRIGHGVGDGCVVDEDCQFTDGVCEIDSLRCVDSTAARGTPPARASPVSPPGGAPPPRASPVSPPGGAARALAGARGRVSGHGARCGGGAGAEGCAPPLECSPLGACVCPAGYYLSDDGELCSAELGSPSSREQCVGLLARVEGGICSCPPNFFYDENMRDCTKATRRVTDSCVTDPNCHTFGAAGQCGAPRDPWGLRECRCDPARAVWDAARGMCRLFAGIGESCEVDTDCLAGELEIQCVSGRCACPPGLVAAEGLCLTTGLALGDRCQASAECTATPHTECSAGACSCSPGYRDVAGSCAPVIGGSCGEDAECAIPDTECSGASAGAGRAAGTCRCRSGFVPYEELCYTVAAGLAAPCNVTAQCSAALGPAALCDPPATPPGVAPGERRCACAGGHHHRDGRCWPITNLFEPCVRTSQCYLGGESERAECRNSLCQCSFPHPYSEELRTCVHSAASSSAVGGAAVVLVALTYMLFS